MSLILHLQPSNIQRLGGCVEEGFDIVLLSYGRGTLGFIFTSTQQDMSFWKEFPGPTWWDCIESFNPCSTKEKYGVCHVNLTAKPRTTRLPKAFRKVILHEKHATELEGFLSEHFSLYPRCKISLSKDRIFQGFHQEEWLGIGVYLMDKTMIGCCISKPLGRLKFPHQTFEQGGIVDYFCVHSKYRKNGIASYMLDELVHLTAKKERTIHCFLKEGFPLLSLPPLYASRYIARRRGYVGEGKDYLHKLNIGLHSPIMSYSHADYFPISKYVANLPHQFTGDSELYSFQYRGHNVFMCITNLHHKTVPEEFTLGELSWILPQTIEVPLAIQQLAVETCIDSSGYDILLMDQRIPHDTKKEWQRDASFSWYLYNYNPGEFFHVKPFWIL